MKHIVITGTSRGMGYEMVKLFAEKGYKVLALSRNDKPVSELNLENVTAISCDISKAEDLEKVSAFVETKWKQVDVLINNAGTLINKDFEKISAEEFQQIYSTNVFGVIGLTQKMLPFMKKDAHVVNISTMGGVQGSVKF
ncbi:MAG: SDR family oxidoreductase, partial [Salegentibacter mishustinae]|nr:SDR family oxidoreductase [Salegentibacter mishustinae]